MRYTRAFANLSVTQITIITIYATVTIGILDTCVHMFVQLSIFIRYDRIDFIFLTRCTECTYFISACIHVNFYIQYIILIIHVSINRTCNDSQTQNATANKTYSLHLGHNMFPNNSTSKFLFHVKN